MSIDKKVTDQCIALAAMAQSIRVVQNIAWKGTTNDTDFKAVLVSILKTQAPSAAAIYNGSFELSTGLRILNGYFDPLSGSKDPEFIHLAINLIVSNDQLNKTPKILNSLTKDINWLSEKFNTEDIYTDDEIYQNYITECSEVYKKTLSRLSHRIKVNGKPEHLKQSKNQDRVRAALLAGIRACVLWRQLGGTRWHFLFKKALLTENIKHLISNPIRE
ncbi:MAG: high frequency lysogenization protein HflD [Gammaproteobacteria bacterium]|nr:high frequency lysogenization protein HflD [Gammaproteobacteria bacterium]MDH5629940.1 high frequency lysogenization protein HflD [Gammaproteobacteria bacterium]